MPIVPVDFINVASDISNIGNEAAFRSSISRAYYGSFNQCKEMADVKLSHTSHIKFADSSHENLLRQMENEPLLSGWRSVAYMMRILKTERVESDYQMNASVIESDALNAISKANLIIGRLNQIP